MLRSIFTLSRPARLVLINEVRRARYRSGLPVVNLLSTSSCTDDYNTTHGSNRRGHTITFLTLFAACYASLYFITNKKKENLAYCLDSRSKRFNFLAETVEKVSPCVVLVEPHRSQQERLPFLFNSQGNISSHGSGFIIDEGNYVLTNAHVVGSAHHVTIKLHDGRKLRGSVTDLDEVADLALIKLDLSKSDPRPSALDFGSSADLRPGEWVIALGSPLSLSNTITSGIVSSVHRPASEIPDRSLQYQKPHMEYIQTDAAITFGNSGGPLVNLDGEVIGINTMTAGPGISFAVPSDFAKKFLKKANRNIKRSTKYTIGISMLTITPNVRNHIQYRTSFHVSHGVFLAEVWRGSPADVAGLRRHDIIIGMNSQSVTSTDQIYKEVQAGREIIFEVIRGNEKKRIRVKPEPM